MEKLTVKNPKVWKKYLERERRIFRGIKNKDVQRAATIISEWSSGFFEPSEISNADIAELIRALCQCRCLGEFEKAVDALERARASPGAKIRWAYYELFGDSLRNGVLTPPSSRDIAKRTGASERTVRFVLEESGLDFLRLKPWQKNK